MVSLPSERSARSQTSPGRVSERQILPLLGLGRVCSQRTQRACGTAMRSCASLSRGVAAPLGCAVLLLSIQRVWPLWKDLTKCSGRVTVEAVRAGSATISLKGKIRTILLPGKLCKKLLKYARKRKITSDEIFLTGGGKPMSRCQIWAEMKCICKTAGVDSLKVFPHNLRHLFATVYYRIYKDIVKLADILGHSSVETTRIYLLTTGTEHRRRQLERLRLVL